MDQRDKAQAIMDSVEENHPDVVIGSAELSHSTLNGHTLELVMTLPD